MKLTERWKFISVLSALTIASPAFSMKSPGDSLHFKSGKTCECRVLRSTHSTIFVELQTSPESHSIESAFAMDELQSISLAGIHSDASGKLERALSIETLKRIWQAMHPLIGLPGNNLALVGMNLSEMMVASDDSALASEALSILAFVKTNSCDHRYKVQAADAEMGLFERLKLFPQAKEAAERFVGPGNLISLRLRANLTIGICGHEEMRLFLEENPRWQQDPRVQTERKTIYERTLDSFSFTSLFGGETEQLSGRALYQEAKFHLLCGERVEAERVYKQLSTRFQGSKYIEQLKNELTIVIHPR
jgi:hypothetical protein